MPTLQIYTLFRDRVDYLRQNLRPALAQQGNGIDVLFNATSTAAHMEHWPVLRKPGKMVIDMMPAQTGKPCAPAINAERIIEISARNICMIICGGQVPMPIPNAIAAVQDDIE